MDEESLQWVFLDMVHFNKLWREDPNASFREPLGKWEIINKNWHIILFYNSSVGQKYAYQ